MDILIFLSIDFDNNLFLTALFPTWSVLTDLGLFNITFGHFGSVFVVVKKNIFYSNLGT